MGTELVQSMIPLSQIMLRYDLSLFEYIFTQLNTFQVTNRYFIAATTQQLYRYLPQVVCRNVSLETKELSKTDKTRFEKVDCTGSTVLPTDVTSCQKISYASNKKKKTFKNNSTKFEAINNSPVQPFLEVNTKLLLQRFLARTSLPMVTPS